MSEVKLGHLLEHSLATRDAVHFAVLPVESKALRLFPGQFVKISGVYPYVEVTHENDPDYLGVVDPFYRKQINHGERFWIIMRPGSTQNLRHAWDHPQVPNDTECSTEPYDDGGCSGCY